MLVNTPTCGPISVARTGPSSAPTVVFLHPVSLDGTWFNNQIAVFSDDYDVITMDMPGHGLSPAPISAISFENLADAVISVLETLDVSSAHIVGVSFGGMIAQYVALRRPDLVRSLMLTGTTHTAASAREMLHQRAETARAMGMAHIAQGTIDRWFGPGFDARRPDIVNRALLTVTRHDPEVHGAVWDMVAELDLSDEVGAVTAPVLVMAGDADVNTPAPIVQAMAKAFGNAPIEMIEGVGHFPPIEAPEQFNLILKRFLENVETTLADRALVEA